MTNRCILVLVLLFVSLVPLPISGEDLQGKGGESTPCEGTSFRNIKPCMQMFVDDGDVSGLVALLDRKGSVPHSYAVGQYEPDTIFQIMSMTKPFISVAILILVEQGRIPSTDMKVSELTEFHDFPYSNITIKQLLTHTAGMWYKKEVKPGVWYGIGPQLTNKLDKAPAVTVRDKSLEFVANHYTNPSLYPLDSPPLTHRYSNIGYMTLGWIVERLSGDSVEQFMRREIFDKLGMKDTFFFPENASQEQRSRIAALDRRRPDPPDYSHYEETRPGWVYTSPAGGLYSTAEDLRKFLSLFRHRGQLPGNDRILNPSSIDLLMLDQLSETEKPGWEGRTMGFYVVRSSASLSRPELSPGTIKHSGRFLTWFYYNPGRDEISVLLCQRVRGDEPNPERDARNAFLKLIKKATAE